MRRDEALEAHAARLYGEALPYHNFRHALEAVCVGAEIVARCRTEGVPIDERVVYYALLFHDAGYHEDHVAMGHATKEDYSAALAAAVLRERGAPDDTIKEVVAAILATHRDAVFVTTEQKAVRAADLAGLAANYERFRTNSENLKTEWELLHKRSISWCEWISRATGVIEFVLTQDIRLTQHYADPLGGSAFHNRTRANLERLRREKCGGAG
ncbi:MAG: hypothetical protein ACT4NU_11340 [Chromatiales bacterium]